MKRQEMKYRFYLWDYLWWAGGNFNHAYASDFIPWISIFSNYYHVLKIFLLILQS